MGHLLMRRLLGRLRALFINIRLARKNGAKDTNAVAHFTARVLKKKGFKTLTTGRGSRGDHLSRRFKLVDRESAQTGVKQLTRVWIRISDVCC